MVDIRVATVGKTWEFKGVQGSSSVLKSREIVRENLLIIASEMISCKSPIIIFNSFVQVLNKKTLNIGHVMS